MRIILRTDNTFTIIDVRFTSMTSETRLACTSKHDIITFENRMTFNRVV